MESSAPSTSFVTLSPRAARTVLIAFAALAIFCVGVTFSPLKSDHRFHNMPGEGDLALYKAEAKRMQSGESYYSAVAAELRARGYPMQSPFNWRTPLPLWFFGKLPSPAAPILLGATSALVLLLGFRVLEREAGALATLIGMPLLFGSLAACWIEPLYYLTELWAGVFITLSLCCYATGRRWMGVATGLAAQFLRELSLLYSLISLGLAIRAKQYREAAVWALGLLCYGAFLGYHVATVSKLIRPDDLFQPAGWIQLGGTAFIVGTAHLNSVILTLPQWVAALYFCLAMIGFAGWNSTVGQRFGLTMAAYVMAFAVVGLYYNQYWGALYAPILCFGAARSPAALRDLVMAAGWMRQEAGAVQPSAAN